MEFVHAFRSMEFLLLQPRSALRTAPPCGCLAARRCSGPVRTSVYTVGNVRRSPRGEGNPHPLDRSRGAPARYRCAPTASLGVILFRGCPLRQVSCYTLPSGCQPSWPPTCYHQQTTPFVVSEYELAVGHRNPALSVHPASPVQLTSIGPQRAGTQFAASQKRDKHRTRRGRKPRTRWHVQAHWSGPPSCQGSRKGSGIERERLGSRRGPQKAGGRDGAAPRPTFSAPPPLPSQHLPHPFPCTHIVSLEFDDRVRRTEPPHSAARPTRVSDEQPLVRCSTTQNSLPRTDWRVFPATSTHSAHAQRTAACANASALHTTPGSSYPGGNFEGNQLPDGSMSLSPLYPAQTNDLHVSTAISFHRGFPRVHCSRK